MRDYLQQKENEQKFSFDEQRERGESTFKILDEEKQKEIMKIKQDNRKGTDLSKMEMMGAHREGGYFETSNHTNAFKSQIHDLNVTPLKRSRADTNVTGITKDGSSQHNDEEVKSTELRSPIAFTQNNAAKEDQDHFVKSNSSFNNMLSESGDMSDTQKASSNKKITNIVSLL